MYNCDIWLSFICMKNYGNIIRCEEAFLKQKLTIKYIFALANPNFAVSRP
jgi:hypothetical protein